MASDSDELEIFQYSLPDGAHRQIDQSSRFRIDQEWNSASDPQPEEN